MEEYYRKLYIRRINSVIDFIDANISEELPLHELAGIAHFSPFHFHRIFSVFVGEAPAAYVRRIRLEKSARLIIGDRFRPVSDIAQDCGFSSIHVFSRAFKLHFRQSPTEFRKCHSKDGQTDSKNHQSKSKDSQTTHADDIYLRIESQKQSTMKNKIEVKEMPGLKLMYCRHVGAFDQIGAAYGKLMQYAGPRGLLRFPKTKTVTVYHDDPAITDISKVRQSACITLDEEVKAEGEFGTMELPKSRCAVGRFEVTPDGFGKAWDDMCIWVADSGYQPDEGLPYELYYADPEHHPEGKFVLDICIPVRAMD